MKLAEIPGGFALYKEKTAVGRCEVTATAQGAALTLLTIVPEWRRKGYGSYLLKEVLRRFGGYDKETATVFTAPLPGDEGERAFWEKFGFRAEGAQLCRRRTPDLTAVKFVQDFLTSRLAEPKLLVDATCGNGGDTAFLCRLAGKEGRVLGFDIQPEAIASTERNLAAKGLSAELHCDSHANLLQYVTPGTADAVMFNSAGCRGRTTTCSPMRPAASPRWKRPSMRCGPAGCSVPSCTAGGSSARTRRPRS